MGWVVQDRLVQDRLRTVVILVHLRSFTTVLVGFLPQKYRGTGNVHGVRVMYTLFVTSKWVLFGLPTVYTYYNYKEKLVINIVF